MAILGDGPINQIESIPLENAVRDMLTTNEHYPAAPATANRIRSTCRAFFAWCLATGLTVDNPASALRLQKSPSPRTVGFKPGELDLFFQAIRLSGDPRALRDEALFGIYACTGLRRGEALQLLLGDYDRVQRLLFIRRSKTGDLERMPISTTLASVLETYIRNADIDDEGYLFPGYRCGAPLSSRQAHVRFEKWKAHAALRPDLTIHSFRVSFASLVYQESRDILLVSRALGHKDVRTTDRYVRLGEWAMREVVERVFAGERSLFGE